MRENRTYGSEGGGTEFNRSSLPLSFLEFASLKSSFQTFGRLRLLCDKYICILMAAGTENSSEPGRRHETCFSRCTLPS